MKSLTYKPRRNRLIYLSFFFIGAYLGLLSRWYTPQLPWLVGKYFGDYVSGLMGVGIIGAVWPRLSLRTMCAASIVLLFTDEFTQAYHAPWADAIRDTFVGGLLFGHGFVASDLVCYALGAFTGLLLEWLWYSWKPVFPWQRRLV